MKNKLLNIIVIWVNTLPALWQHQAFTPSRQHSKRSHISHSEAMRVKTRKYLPYTQLTYMLSQKWCLTGGPTRFITIFPSPIAEWSTGVQLTIVPPVA